MNEKLNYPEGDWSVSDKDASGNVSEHYLFIEPGIAVIERKVTGQDENDMRYARLIAAAPELIGLLMESQTSIGGDWRARRDAVIAKATGKTSEAA